MSIEDYYRTYEVYPATDESARAKERANARYQRLIREVSENISPILVIAQEAVGADIDNYASSFEFTLVYDREEYIYTYNELYGVSGHATEDYETLSGINAIKRQIARIFLNTWEENRYISYLPEQESADKNYQSIELLEVGTTLSGTLETRIDTAETNITVTIISNT